MRIEFGGAELFPELQPLWEALFDHHHSVGDAGLAIIPREESWPLRRAHYERLFAGHPWAGVWLVRDPGADGRAVGYALAYGGELDGRRAVTLETLSLLPRARGAGLGSELMRLVAETAAARGCEVGIIDVMGGNERARELYLRAGYRPRSEAWMRSTPPSTTPAGHAVREVDTRAAAPADAELVASSRAAGFALDILPGPDDSWVSSDRFAELTPYDPERGWLAGELERLFVLLESAGLWTVIVELPTAPAAAALRGMLIGEEFRLSMERLVRELG